MTTGGRLNNSSGNLTLLTVVIVVAIIYFARVVLIPLALAVLFAFLLGPLVVRFRSWGLGRIPAATVVVLFSLTIAGGLSYIMLTQFADLANRLPGYQENMQKKIQSIRDSGGGVVNRVSRMVYQLNDQLKPPTREAVGTEESTDKPVPVEIRQTAFAPMDMLQKVAGSVVQVLVTAAIVVVFVLFLLIQRQDLRERILRLAGAGRINLTTTVLDDTARRVSRYLLAQLALNSGYGALAGIGLYFIGVPNPLLWAILTMLLRYVPYVGIWIAAAMPGALAFATDPGWTQLLLIVVLYFGIDMLMYNFLEPLLYGSSTGLTPMAVLVTTVFWTWLWGPVGLLLATPLTVCVVVLGRHIPKLQFFSIMLSDESPLTDDFRFYQRMLAMDQDEASQIARKAMEGSSLEEVYDKIIIPALSLAERERHHGKLGTERMKFFVRGTHELIDQLAHHCEELVQGKRVSKDARCKKPLPSTPQQRSETRVICIPARDESDEIAAAMLVNLLKIRGIQADSLSSMALAGEALQVVARERPHIACVCSVPPFGYRQTRYLCGRLRAQWPGLKLVAAILTEREVDHLRQRQPSIPADELATTLAQVLALAVSLVSVGRDPTVQPAAAA